MPSFDLKDPMKTIPILQELLFYINYLIVRGNRRKIKFIEQSL